MFPGRGVCFRNHMLFFFGSMNGEETNVETSNKLRTVMFAVQHYSTVGFVFATVGSETLGALQLSCGLLFGGPRLGDLCWSSRNREDAGPNGLPLVVQLGCDPDHTFMFDGW